LAWSLPTSSARTWKKEQWNRLIAAKLPGSGGVTYDLCPQIAAGGHPYADGSLLLLKFTSLVAEMLCRASLSRSRSPRPGVAAQLAQAVKKLEEVESPPGYR